MANHRITFQPQGWGGISEEGKLGFCILLLSADHQSAKAGTMSNSTIYSLTPADLLKLIPGDQNVHIKDLLVAVQLLANDVPRAEFAAEFLDFLVTGVSESRGVWDPAFFLESRGITAQPDGWSTAPVITRLAFALLLLPRAQQTRVAAEQVVEAINALPPVSGQILPTSTYLGAL